MDLREYMSFDATALAEQVTSGNVTATELLDLARARAAEVNPKLNAIIRPMDAIADERASGQLSGPFAGVPFLLKDLAQEYEGVPTTYGSRALKNNVADRHATVVKRWLDAGLVVFGKTNAPEFGAKGITEPELFGPSRNPFDLSRTPGGSSGGSAAAVAAGVVPAAGANDGGGSIRIPAACCGLVGLKPTRGLAPYGPIFAEALHGMAVQGVVSRTVRDSAALLDAMIGPEATGTYLPAMPERPLAEQLAAAPGKLRIGFSAKSAINRSPDPEALHAVENAASLLAELGHEVEEVDPPYNDDALARDFLTIWFAQVATVVAMTKLEFGATSKDFEADTIVMAELGRAGGVVASAAALERRNDYVATLAEFHTNYDLFMTPTLAKPPLVVGSLDTPPHLQRLSRAVAAVRAGKALQKLPVVDEMIDGNLGWVPFTQLANLTGRPAISLPLHWTGDGLPLGVQFVGTLGSEALLLQLGAQLEQAKPWADRHPAQLN